MVSKSNSNRRLFWTDSSAGLLSVHTDAANVFQCYYEFIKVATNKMIVLYGQVSAKGRKMARQTVTISLVSLPFVLSLTIWLSN